MVSRWTGKTPTRTVGGGTQQTLRFLLLCGMAAVIAVSLLKPLNDPDFFWHLKTGEWIWEHRELPARDPFNYLNEEVPADAQKFTLTASWLTQLVYYLAHREAGMAGILCLKIVIALLLVAALLRDRCADPLVRAALVLLALPLLCIYSFDRPNILSFFFFAVLLALLDEARTAAAERLPPRLLFTIPAVMLLWANMHGGHAAGQLLILVFLVAEGVKFSSSFLRPIPGERFRGLLIVGGLGLAASFINPNTYHALGNALVSSPAGTGQAFNAEYLSAAVFFRGQRLIAIFFVALVLAAAAVLRSHRKPDLTWIAVLAATGYAGYAHVRYVPFFLIAALSVLGSLFDPEPRSRWRRPALVSCSALLALFTIARGFPSPGQAQRALHINEEDFPVRAADAILELQPRGNLYNTYNWGGYLLWRLAPERRVFVDGRGLNPVATDLSFAVNGAYEKSVGGLPPWRAVLRRYGVGYLVIPRVVSWKGIEFDGAAPLRRALLRAPEWVLVYADEISLVFVLSAPEHFELIKRFGISKERVLGHVLPG